MLNKRFFIGVLAGLLSCSTVSAATTLKIASLAPDSTTWMKEMRAGAAEVEKLTEGRVKFKFYPGGVMGNDANVLRKMRIGQLQGGAVTTGAFAKIFPNAQIYGLPFQFRSIDEVNYARQHMDPMISQGLDEKGFTVLGISNGGFAYGVGIKPVTGITDLRQQRVWVPQGDVINETVLRSMGVSPVLLPLADVYTALQTGLLDAVTATPSAVIAFQWHTKVKYFLETPIVFIVGMLVVDKRAFNKIAKQDQVIVKKTMSQMFKKLDDLNHIDNEKAVAALRANGIEFLQPNPEEFVEWQNAAKVTLVELKKKGIYSEAFYDELQKHLKMFRKQVSAK